MIKSNLGSKGFTLSSTSTSQYIIEGSLGRNMESETEAEAMGKQYLLTCSYWLAQSAFSYYQGLPAQDNSILNGLDPHLKLTIKKMPYRLAFRQSDEDIFSIEVPLPDNSILYQLTKINRVRRAHQTTAFI